MSLPILNTPTYELNLPSTGQKVTYRPFLVKEHKILLSMTGADDAEAGRIVRELVDVCTFNKLNVSKLPHFDVEYIFLNLRAKSIGENVEVVVNCDCGNKIETSFNIDDLKIEKLPDHTNKIMLTDTVGVEMSYPLFDDVINVFSNDKAEDVFNLVISCIHAIYDQENYYSTEDYSKEELEEFLNTLTKQQFDKIENFFTNSPKVVQEVETDCDKCGRHNVSRLEGLANFFV
jgi:hypothetical protein